MIIKYSVGDIVELKKEHPCGNKQWEITRVGVDFKVKCIKCNHVVMLTREKFEKSVKHRGGKLEVRGER